MNDKIGCVIKNSKVFAENLLNNIPIPIIVTTMDKRIYYVNTAFEEITGFCEEDVFGRLPPYPWWPENKIIEYKEMFNSIFISNKKIYKEIKFRTKEEKDIWVDLIPNIVKDNGNSVFISLWYDVTNDVLTKKKLEEEINKRIIEWNKEIKEKDIKIHQNFDKIGMEI